MARCVESLLATNPEVQPKDIFVIDNCSDDSAKCKEYSSKYGCQFIQSQTNRGYNAGNNIGLKAAAEQGYGRALIANPDMIFTDRGYLEELNRVMDADPRCVAAGSRIFGPKGDDQSPMADDPNESAWSSWGWVKDMLPLRRGNRTWIDRPGEAHTAAKLSGSCLLVDLEKIKSVGWMDENVFLYCEEAILARQAVREGWTMRYTPEVSIQHHHVSSEKGDPRPRFRTWRRSRLYYIRTYSSHGRFGRAIESLSIRTYTSMLILISTIRKWLEK